MTVQSQFAREIPNAVYLPRLPYIFEFQTEFNNAIEKALRGSETPQKALDQAAANIDTIIQRQKQNDQAMLRASCVAKSPSSARRDPRGERQTSQAATAIIA